MTHEEIEKRIEFIIVQQAQFTSDIHQLRESQAQTDQLLNRLAAVTLEGFKDVNAKLDALVDSHTRLSEAQGRTEESLRNLIAITDRHFRERNGKSEG
jgi:ElaB/YqjD/DUF883 family membrane-anchored ribosome-binding protein